jgi:hypothetical protein
VGVRASRPPSRIGRIAGRFGNAGTAALLAGREAVRPKLELGAVSDPLEREADATADKVVRMKAGGDCAACARGDPCDGGAAKVRRASDGGGGAAPLGAEAEASIRRATSGGEPLPGKVRAAMEPAFGADFSGVRVHRDAAAADSARGIGARAYTVGNHIAFGQGQWAPGTHRGDHLIAHELTHTLQDGGATARTVRGNFLDDIADAAGAATDWARDTAAGAAQGVTDAAGRALDWVETQAGNVALAAARSLARRFGGNVEIGRDGLIITLPNVPLFEGRRFVLSPPMRREFITLAAAGAPLGPVLLRGRIGIPLSPPTVTAFLGPGRLQDIRIRIDPSADTYSAQGQIYVGAALDVAIETGIGARVDAITALPTVPPFPIEASVEGGLLAVLNASAVGSLQEAVRLAYSGGDIRLDLDSRVRLGLILSARLSGYLNAQLYDVELCEWIWPIDGAHWESSRGVQFDLPISLSNSGDGFGAEVGELTAVPFPAREIETDLTQYHPQSHCLALEELIATLCQRSVLPAALCPDPDRSQSGGAAAAGPPGMGFGPSGGGHVGPSSGGHVPVVPGGKKAPTGSRNDPIAMTWFKPIRYYPNPIWLKFDPTDRDERAEPYRRNERKRLPSGRQWIGVSYWPEVGDKLRRAATPEGNAKSEFREALIDHGWDVWQKRQDADHVQDLAFAGPDSFANLWPLDGNVNQFAGRHHYQQIVEYSDPADPPGAPPKRTLLGYLPNRWFKIARIRSPI